MQLVLAPKDVEKALGVSKLTLLRMRQRGDLPYIKLSPRRIGFLPGDIEAYLLARRIDHGADRE